MASEPLTDEENERLLRAGDTIGIISLYFIKELETAEYAKVINPTDMLGRILPRLTGVRRPNSIKI